MTASIQVEITVGRTMGDENINIGGDSFPPDVLRAGILTPNFHDEESKDSQTP